MIQKSGVHQLRLVVEIPLFTIFFLTSQVVVWDCFQTTVPLEQKKLSTRWAPSQSLPKIPRTWPKIHGNFHWC